MRDSRARRARGGLPARGAEAAEMALHQGGRGLVIQVPGRREDDVGGAVDALEERPELLAAEAEDALPRPEDGTPQGMVGPEGLGEELHHEVVGGVFDHLDLLEDDLLLLGHLDGIEEGVHHDVAEDLDGQRKVLVQDLQVEGGVLLGGEGVHVPPDGVHLGRDLLGRAGAGPLEDHVLDEVADPRLGRRLVSASPLQPNADGHAADVGHGFGEEREAVRKNFLRDHVGGPGKELKRTTGRRPGRVIDSPPLAPDPA